ncbi:MAG: hypothetical protein O7F12_06110 [Nitrospirae bacterium]|nr:hypothetical protein [Nitrospirota bacterium]
MWKPPGSETRIPKLIGLLAFPQILATIQEGIRGGDHLFPEHRVEGIDSVGKE